MINHNNQPITDNKQIANTFNDFYANLGKNIEKKIPKSNKKFEEYLNMSPNYRFDAEPCDNAETLSIISNFVTNKSSGPNSIPTDILKEFIHLRVNPIKMIVNKSLAEGVFPSIFKIAQICPIYKKDDKSKCVNYRPISLLSNLSKIIERVMYNRLESYLENNNIIYDHQFGFRKSFSTEHALMSITEQIKSNFASKSYSCGVFVDTVNHQILISKLKYYGLSETSLK